MKFLRKNIENWQELEKELFLVGHFEIYFSKKNIFASFSIKHFKVYWLARIFRNFDDYPDFQQKYKGDRNMNNTVCTMQ